MKGKRKTTSNDTTRSGKSESSLYRNSANVKRTTLPNGGCAANTKKKGGKSKSY